METIILSGKSKKKIALIAELAENLGLEVQREITETEIKEDKALLRAMESGKTGEYVDTKTFLEQLKK
ncbi:MAG TPA: hypothetical protein VFI78_04125 [Salinimicrobium sp.]|nr:hypothetical protein [Salinimicrobium sp.]